MYWKTDPSQAAGFNALAYAAPVQAKQQAEYRNALATALERGNALRADYAAEHPAEYNALEAFGGPTKAAAASLEGGGMGDGWLRYANQGAIRNKPISGKLESALSFLGDMGLTMEVYSGGQDAKGHGDRRTGSVRHDHGNASDVFFYNGDGRKLDWGRKEDIPVLQEIVRRAKANGVTGFGAGPGYMQQGSMHIGFGAPAVWGAGGKGENAPDWLREAFGI